MKTGTSPPTTGKAAKDFAKVYRIANVRHFVACSKFRLFRATEKYGFSRGHFSLANFFLSYALGGL